MIWSDTPDYVIEERHGTPLRFAVDFKKREGGRVHLINVGWTDSYDKALSLKFDHLIKRLEVHDVDN